MSGFNYKNVYIEGGKRVLEINILPEKFCNFDCIFCPVGRSYNKVEKSQSFEGMESSLNELESMIEKSKVDLIFINSKGEALVNDKVDSIIELIKGKGLPVRLLSNGYLLARNEYIKIVNMCDEVIGELKTISEKDFQKIQRPIEGYTLKEYISNMIFFSRQYKGKFILEVTIIKGYNDNEQSINKIKNIINKISPDEIIVEKINDERFKNKLGITNERLNEISKELVNI